MDEISDTPPIVPAKKKGGRPKGSKESREARENRQNRTILDLRAKNVPVPAIATAVKLAPRTVDLRLKKMQTILQQVDKLSDWERDKADYLSAAQHTLLKSMMQEDKLDKASVNNLAYAFTQIHQATRMERGQATQMIATHVRFSKVVPDSVPATHTDAPLPDLPPAKPVT